MVDDNTMIFLP